MRLTYRPNGQAATEAMPAARAASAARLRLRGDGLRPQRTSMPKVKPTITSPVTRTNTKSSVSVPQMGLRLSAAKTSVVHMADGFDFLGFHIQWRRKRGANKWYVYTFIADRPIRSLKAKIRALTRRTSQQDLGYVLTRLNLIRRGWATMSIVPGP